MGKVGLVHKKQSREQHYIDWFDTDPKRQKKYGNIFQQIEQVMVNYQQLNQKNQLLSELTSSSYGSAILAQAYLVYQTAQERQKPEMEREPDFQDRNFDRLKMRIILIAD